MFRKLSCLFAGAAVVMTGCASVSESISNRMPAREVAKALTQPRNVNATEAPDVQALSKASLPAGKCGMLLWTLNEREPVLVFQAVEGEGAEMMIEGADTRLSLTSQSGESRYGITSSQQYTSIDPDTDLVSVNVDASFGLGFEGGVYVGNGLITLTNRQGWERLLPVAGLTGCRA